MEKFACEKVIKYQQEGRLTCPAYVSVFNVFFVCLIVENLIQTTKTGIIYHMESFDIY